MQLPVSAPKYTATISVAWLLRVHAAVKPRGYADCGGGLRALQRFCDFFIFLVVERFELRHHNTAEPTSLVLKVAMLENSMAAVYRLRIGLCAVQLLTERSQ